MSYASKILDSTSGLVRTSFDATVQQSLAAIPGYVAASTALNKLSSRHKAKRLGARQDATVVDSKEFHTSTKRIEKELGATLNPVTKTYNMARWIFGSTSDERASDEINNLGTYAGLYDSYMFANRAMTFLEKQLMRRISQKESLLSKIDLKTDKKLAQDKVIQADKKAIQDWIKSYDTLLEGGDKGVGFTINDRNFLAGMRDRFFYNKHTKDLAPAFDQLLQKADQVFRQNYQKQEAREKQNRKLAAAPNSNLSLSA